MTSPGQWSITSATCSERHPQRGGKHYLLMGPWNHSGTRTPKTEFDGLKVGEASKLDMNSLHKAWYDWTMKSGQPPEFLKQRVAYTNSVNKLA